MKKLSEQTKEKIAAGRKAKPEFMANVDRVIEEQKKFNHGEKAIQLNSKAPLFNLPNQNRQVVSLVDLLAKGPVVVTFYRGSWCPYCNLQLRALQSHVKKIKSLGAELVAISPEVPDGSLSESEISKMKFTVLSDQSSIVAKSYGVAWDVPTFLVEHMKNDRGLNLDLINNADGSILPIPATFIISSEGIIVWRFIDVDYRKRSEPDDIIEALELLQ